MSGHLQEDQLKKIEEVQKQKLLRIEQNAIHENLTKLQTWDLAEGQTLQERLQAHKESLIQSLPQLQENAAMQNAAAQQLGLANAAAAAPGAPVQEQVPAKQTYKQRREQARKEPAAEEEERLESLEGKRVLLVDDNELNREILKEVLTDQGLLVEEADDGSKAVAAVRTNEPGHYHFVLMDVEMPVMDGFEATAQIRKMTNRIRANIPIIALTANAVPENREKAAVVGMDDFLIKPTNSARLLRSLAKFL